MSDYVLLTDSSADLTDKLMREMGVEVLPLSFTIKGKTLFNYPDNREMSAKAFYRLLREGEMATTSAVNISDFTEKMEPLLQAGKDVLVLAFSSALSPPAIPPKSPHRSWERSTRAQGVRGGYAVRLPGPGPAALARGPAQGAGGEH